MMIVEWVNGRVQLIDQRKLPREEVYLTLSTYMEVAEAIRAMVVRGAPAIGVTAAMGVALGVGDSQAITVEELQSDLERVCNVMQATRPTAVNLFWAIERMKRKFIEIRNSSISEIKNYLVEEAKKIHDEDIEINRKMGQNGAELIPDGATVLTHCNAGALATAGYGTALGVIRAAIEQGKRIEVFADETRPFLQGARLTAWELMKDKIPVTLITDNMAGHFMKLGKITCVLVGADRIAANGDVANKIGTYMVAVLAHRHNLPFYVAAPTSTLDMSLKDGEQIPIENRDPKEITCLGDIQIAPESVNVLNPAFDVTPNELISAIITENGVARSDYKSTLAKLITLN